MPLKAFSLIVDCLFSLTPLEICAEVKRYIQERLGIAYVPNEILLVDRLLVRGNGKVERQPQRYAPWFSNRRPCPRSAADAMETVKRYLGAAALSAGDFWMQRGGSSFAAVTLVRELGVHHESRYVMVYW